MHQPHKYIKLEASLRQALYNFYTSKIIHELYVLQPKSQLSTEKPKKGKMHFEFELHCDFGDSKLCRGRS